MAHLTIPQAALLLQLPTSEVRALNQRLKAPLRSSADEVEERAIAQLREMAPASREDDVRWVLAPGETVRRADIHAAYGGQRQSGIVTPRRLGEIIVFTDPVKGAKYGYDKFEGLLEDGSYSYTGEGQTGDQVFRGGNKALRDAAATGRTIRLFTTRGTEATYVGAFTTGDPAYRVEQIPDTQGLIRQGIIFSLVPIDADTNLLPTYGGKKRAVAAPTLAEWVAPRSTDVIVDINESSVTRTVSREEHKLQADFGAWLKKRGEAPQVLRMPAGSATIEPDFYVEALGWIVEAKKSPAREYVRMALGQVLDYAHVASEHGLNVHPVILLPGRPTPDLIDLISGVGVTLVIRKDSSFQVIAAPFKQRQ